MAQGTGQQDPTARRHLAIADREALPLWEVGQAAGDVRVAQPGAAAGLREGGLDVFLHGKTRVLVRAVDEVPAQKLLETVENAGKRAAAYMQPFAMLASSSEIHSITWWMDVNGSPGLSMCQFVAGAQGCLISAWSW